MREAHRELAALCVSKGYVLRFDGCATVVFMRRAVPNAVLILNDVEFLSKIHRWAFLCALFELILQVRIPAEWLSLSVSSGVHLTCIELPWQIGNHWDTLGTFGKIGGTLHHVAHRCLSCLFMFVRMSAADSVAGTSLRFRRNGQAVSEAFDQFRSAR